MSLERCLIIGCGGSGAKTLAYMMDHLRSVLPPEFGDELPAGWQFVTVDVPVSEEAGPEGIPAVSAYRNGSYVGLGPAAGKYVQLDQLVCSGLANSGADLRSIASWVPKQPEKLNILVSEGAGQMRAVGRMVTLSSLGTLREGLESARNAMVNGDNDLYRLANLIGGNFKANAPAPLVLVVSSMAGGAGASMTIDVCRVLTKLPGINSDKVALFLATPDTFTGLDPSARRGVFGNALAMVGEIVSAQAGRAGDDVSLMRDFQVEVKDSPSVGRVFPVGRTRGLDQAEIGLWPNDVYRALGRGLGALLSSPKALEPFVTYDMTNREPTPGWFESFGWGLPQRELEWYSFGYSSLSMGRDRYQEYAAQRLARRTIDHLLDGYMTGVPVSVSGDQRLRELADRAHIGVEARLGLRGEQQSYGEWLSLVGWPSEQLRATAKSVVDELQRDLPNPDGRQATGWLSAIRSRLGERQKALQDQISTQVELRLWAYQRSLVAATLTVAEEAVSSFGLPYAAEIFARVDAAVAAMAELAGREVDKHRLTLPAVGEIDDKLTDTVAQMKKGVVTNGAGLLQALGDGLQSNTRGHLSLTFTSQLTGLWADFRTGFLRKLREEIEEQRRLLNQVRQATGQAAPGVARVDSPFYEHWPRSDAPVPARFGQAANEVLVTEPDQYLAQYDQDVSRAVNPNQRMSAPAAEEAAARLIVTGRWETGDGSPAPEGLILELDQWVPRVFLHNPETRESIHPRPAMIRLCVSAEDILSRSRQFVARRTYSFDEFCSTSLRGYVVGAPSSQQAPRRADLQAKFRTVLENAKPLCSIEPGVVQQIYREAVKFRYKFSDIPFAGDPLAQGFEDHLVNTPEIKHQAGAWGPGNPLSSSDAFRIDVFGSYSHYAPIVYASLINPIRDDYLKQDPEFWHLRRSRPLRAALVMSDAERRALIGGWFVGQITGRLGVTRLGTAHPLVTIVPAWTQDDHASAGQQALEFPKLLTVPKKESGLDLMACVLEAHLAAITGVGSGVDVALAPYVALRELFQRGPVDFLVDSADELLRELLMDERPVPGSRVVELARPGRAVSFDDRRDAVVRFLEERRDWSDGLRARIGTRLGASQALLSVDIADDISSVLDELIEKVRATGEGPGEQW